MNQLSSWHGKMQAITLVDIYYSNMMHDLGALKSSSWSIEFWRLYFSGWDQQKGVCGNYPWPPWLRRWFSLWVDERWTHHDSSPCSLAPGTSGRKILKDDFVLRRWLSVRWLQYSTMIYNGNQVKAVEANLSMEMRNLACMPMRISVQFLRWGMRKILKLSPLQYRVLSF